MKKPIIAGKISKDQYEQYKKDISEQSDSLFKSEGRVDNLENNLLVQKMEWTIGIGDVSWATHGLPNSINAHPHSSHNVSVVHNGIIENSTILKTILGSDHCPIMIEIKE